MTYFLERKEDGFYYRLLQEIVPWIDQVSNLFPKELSLFIIEYCFLKIKKDLTYVILWPQEAFKSVHLVQCIEVSEREHCFAITFEYIQNYDTMVWRLGTFSHCKLG